MNIYFFKQKINKSFPISRWLDTDEGDKKLECDCFPNVKPNQ
jgi:hypothetical protein